MSDERELFKGTAWYYSRYRFGYPQEFFDYVSDLFNLDTQDRVLDLGCGTGQITVPISRFVKEVVGVDPEQEMLDEAKKEAKRAGVKNIKWVLKKAEDIDENFGSFKLTTMGASFHWMDQKLVLKKIYNCTEKNGGVVLVHNSSPWIELDEDWQKIRMVVLKKYLGEKRRAGVGLYKSSSDKFEDLLTNSQFGEYQKWTYTYNKKQTLDEVVNYMYSTSFAQRRFFGDKINEYEEELKKELLKLEPLGIFGQNIVIQALVARKN